MRRVDREHPGCFFFLIDLSDSMNNPFGGERVSPGSSKPPSKADRLATAINKVFSDLIIECTKDISGIPRYYFDIGVIGYGERVGGAFASESKKLAGHKLVSIVDVYNNPARVEERPAERVNAVGDLVVVPEKFRIWFDPVGANGTPMCSALQEARQVLEPWVHSHPRSSPPIVINITDGEATDGDPRQPAQALRELATQDGHLLLFNLHLSSLPGAPILYPESDAALPDEFARRLFEMSSIVPDDMREEAKNFGFTPRPQARGFVFNADIADVIKFLKIGTMVDTALAQGE